MIITLIYNTIYSDIDNTFMYTHRISNLLHKHYLFGGFVDQGSVKTSGLWVQGKNKLKYKIQESLLNKDIHKMNIHSLLKIVFAKFFFI